MSDPKTKGTAQGEPSMEEILASIRRIISEDGDPAKAGAAPATPAAAAPAPTAAPTPAPSAPEPAPVAPPPAAAAPTPAPAPAASDVLELTDIVEEPSPPQPEPPRPAPAAPLAGEDGLISTSVAAAASGSLANLLSAKRQTERGMSDNPMPLGNAGATIESIVREELRPILKAWLDQNLTPMVERMVQREIQRIARNVD